MKDLLSLVLTLLVLVGVLLFMISGARSEGAAARSLRGLGSYTLDGVWAHAILAALALGQIAVKVPVSEGVLLVLACLLGGLCGWFVEPNRLISLILGGVGGLAGIVGSVGFVAESPGLTDLAVRAGTVLALGLLFGLVTLLRLEPLAGLTWFAALSVVVFLASPGGASLAQIGGASAALIGLIGIGAVTSLALLPQIALRLAAVGIAIVKVLGPTLGYIPATGANPFPTIVTTIVVYMAVRRPGKWLGR